MENRIIKFRGKRVDNGEWVYGDLVRIPKEIGGYNEPPSLELRTCITNINFLSRNPVDVIPETVGQYTGLTDKDGVDKIYERDIIGVDGLKKGNIYETSTSQIYESGQIFKQGIACIVEKMGTKAWRNSEQTLLELGCKYSK